MKKAFKQQAVLHTSSRKHNFLDTGLQCKIFDEPGNAADEHFVELQSHGGFGFTSADSFQYSFNKFCRTNLPFSVIFSKER